MTEQQINAFGVAIAAAATGWMQPADVTPENADARLLELVHRLVDGALWEAELEGGSG